MKDNEVIPSGWGGNSKPVKYLNHLFIQYKIGMKEFNAMWVAQEGKCKECGIAFAHPTDRSKPFGVRCQVDHKHVEGERCKKEDVRGLLCGLCNKLVYRLETDRSLSLAQLAHMKTLQNNAKETK